MGWERGIGGRGSEYDRAACLPPAHSRSHSALSRQLSPVHVAPSGPIVSRVKISGPQTRAHGLRQAMTWWARGVAARWQHTKKRSLHSTGNQCQSVFISGSRWQPVAFSGDRWQLVATSVALSGNRWQHTTNRNTCPYTCIATHRHRWVTRITCIATGCH